MKALVKQLQWNRWFFMRSEIDRILTVAMAFSALMVVARILYTGELTFIFLNWNLFLAYLPYALSKALSTREQWMKNKLKLIVVFVAWILLIPNSFYIITDLFHLGVYRNIPLWFDLALILSFAWNGLLLGILSVRHIEKVLQVYVPYKTEWLFIYPIMWLNALGVYIGRYLRFNSWDVISNPFALVGDIVTILLHPIQYKYAWGMIFCFSVFMTLMYLTIKKLSIAVSDVSKSV